MGLQIDGRKAKGSNAYPKGRDADPMADKAILDDPEQDQQAKNKEPMLTAWHDQFSAASVTGKGLAEIQLGAAEGDAGLTGRAGGAHGHWSGVRRGGWTHCAP